MIEIMSQRTGAHKEQESAHRPILIRSPLTDAEFCGGSFDTKFNIFSNSFHAFRPIEIIPVFILVQKDYASQNISKYNLIQLRMVSSERA